MCAIAGMFGNKISVIEVGKMLNSMHHRGPDNTDFYHDQGYAILGHNRLSIIDLTTEANQPMSDTTGRYHLTFNGEIYNYKELKSEFTNEFEFRTNSDSEVLLALFIKYGSSCLKLLNGMFSFAIWDSKEKSLFAARDRFGVKPFYYTNTTENTFLFSSEIQAFHKVGVSKSPNRSVWANYFSKGSYGMPNETFWEGIHQLEPGHYFVWSNNDIQFYQWYDVLNLFEQKQISYTDAIEELNFLVEDSIKIRLRSDVPLGINLSGGLDSSMLLHYTSQNENRIEDFESFTFYTGDDRYDELPWVQHLIAQYKHNSNFVRLSQNDVIAISQEVSRFQREPYGGIPTVAYYNVFQKAISKNIKVLMDGQGVDEVFLGYDYYTSLSNNSIQGTKASPFKPELFNFINKERIQDFPEPFTEKYLNLQYRDICFTKLPRALRFNDRISMANSVELREPFLDFRLVEFGLSLPISFKINGSTGKHIVRQLMSDKLPSQVNFSPKRALQTPQIEWMKGPLFLQIKENIELIKNTRYRHWFKWDLIDRELEKFKSLPAESSFHIWQLYNFSLLFSND
jgi:asparagine synthase (glutamine-hydrolysing)